MCLLGRLEATRHETKEENERQPLGDHFTYTSSCVVVMVVWSANRIEFSGGVLWDLLRL